MPLEHIETGSFALKSSHPVVSEALRVVSWNINRGCSFDLIVDFLADVDADVLLLQECDSNVQRSGFRNVARDIAQKLKMNYIFGTEFLELSQGKRNHTAHHGQATLSRMQFSNSRILRFGSQSSFWVPRWFLPNVPRLQRRLGGRMALVTEIVVNQTTVALYNLHLESRSGDELRCRQLQDVLDDTHQYGPEVPVIIGGDFNSDITPGSIGAAIAKSQFRNPFAAQNVNTITAQRRMSGRSGVIDWILIRGLLSKESPRVHNSASGSDHYPLSVTLRF